MRFDRRTGRLIKEVGHWDIVTAWRKHGIKRATKGVLVGYWMTVTGIIGLFLIAGLTPPYHGVLSRITLALVFLGGLVMLISHYLEKARKSRHSNDR